MFEIRCIILLFFTITIPCVISLRVFKLNKGVASDASTLKLKDVNRKYFNIPQLQGRKNNKFYFYETPNRRGIIQPDTSIKWKSLGVGRTFSGKSRLVSRIIPHGFKGDKYEYDSKLNTIYKPLIRFHVKKSLKEMEETSAQDDKVAPIGYLIVITNSKKMNKGAKYEKKRKRERKLKNLDLFAKRNGEEILEALNEHSHELVDDFEPGKKPITHHDEYSQRPYKTFPAYPFWNYWTYEKTIVQDECPGDLVRLGDKCIAPVSVRREIER